MAVTFRNVGTVAGGTSTNPSPGMPGSWAANDIHILVMVSRDNQTHSCSGWTQWMQTANGTSEQISIWWRRAQAGDSAPTVSRSTNTAVCAAQIAGFYNCLGAGTGAVGTSPFDSGSTTTNVSTTSGTNTVTAITTAVNASMVVATWGHAHATNATEARAYSSGGVATTATTIGLTGSSTTRAAVQFAYGVKATAGSTANQVYGVTGVTPTSTYRGNSLLVALRDESIRYGTGNTLSGSGTLGVSTATREVSRNVSGTTGTGTLGASTATREVSSSTAYGTTGTSTLGASSGSGDVVGNVNVRSWNSAGWSGRTGRTLTGQSSILATAAGAIILVGSISATAGGWIGETKSVEATASGDVLATRQDATATAGGAILATRSDATSSAGGWVEAAGQQSATASGYILATLADCLSTGSGVVSATLADCQGTAGGWVLSVRSVTSTAGGEVWSSTPTITATASGLVRVPSATIHLRAFDPDGLSPEVTVTVIEGHAIEATAGGEVGDPLIYATATGWVRGDLHGATASAGGYVQQTMETTATAGGEVASQASIHVRAFDSGGLSAPAGLTVWPVGSCVGTASGWVKSIREVSVTAGGLVAAGGHYYVRAFNGVGLSLPATIRINLGSVVNAAAGGWIQDTRTVQATAGGEVFAPNITATAGGDIFDTPTIQATAGGEVFIQGPFVIRFVARIDQGDATRFVTVNIGQASSAMTTTAGGVVLAQRQATATGSGFVQDTLQTSATAGGEVSVHRQTSAQAGGFVLLPGTVTTTVGGNVCIQNRLTATVGGWIGDISYAASRFRIWNGSAWV